MNWLGKQSDQLIFKGHKFYVILILERVNFVLKKYG